MPFRNNAINALDSLESSGGLDLRENDHQHRPGGGSSGIGKTRPGSTFGTSFQRSSSSSLSQSSGRSFEGMRNLGNTCYLSSVLQVTLFGPTVLYIPSNELALSSVLQVTD